jgi:hypothetical protein
MTDENFRYIAFFMITGFTEAHAATPEAAKDLAARHLPNADFIEVLDCGANGLKVWTGGVEPANPVPLHRARARHTTVYRGAGYAPARPAVALSTV